MVIKTWSDTSLWGVGVRWAAIGAWP